MSLCIKFWFYAALVNLSLAHDLLLNNIKFPEEFLFGVATAAYQIEGAWDVDGKSPSIWDNYTHSHPNYIADGSNADVSCDSYHKYKEDVALLKAIGVNHYRFSLAWTRILPTGYADQINEAGVNYYKDLIRELKANGIQPMITLLHGDLPQSFQDLGGILNPKFPDWFADYARVCFELFGEDVSYWLTINEPYQDCTDGPAGLPFVDGVDTYICALRYLTAHAKAWHIYNEEFRKKQKGKVAIVLNRDWMEPASSKDRSAAETLMQFTFGWFAHPLYRGDWPDLMKSRIAMRSKLEGFNQSRLPQMTQEEIRLILGTNDFFALNSYSTSLVEAIPEPDISTPSRTKDTGVLSYPCPICNASSVDGFRFAPWGMRKLLNWIKNEYSGPDIFITENGWPDGTGQLDDDDRLNYLKEYLSNIRDAMVTYGVSVIGYTQWTLLDNFEWGLGYTAKFGSVHVDFDSPNRTRTRKNSSFYYEKVCKTRCLLDKCVG